MIKGKALGIKTGYSEVSKRGKGDREGKEGLCGVYEEMGGRIYFGVIISQFFPYSETIVLYYCT